MCRNNKLWYKFAFDVKVMLNLSNSNLYFEARADCWKKKCGILVRPDIFSDFVFFILPHKLYIVGEKKLRYFF